MFEKTPAVIDIGCILKIDSMVIDGDIVGTAIQISSQNSIQSASMRGGNPFKARKIDFDIITTGATIYVRENINIVLDLLGRAGVYIFSSELSENLYPSDLPMVVEDPEPEGSQPEWPPEDGES